MADETNTPDAGQLVAAPLESLIEGIGRSVGEAQRGLDHASARAMMELGAADEGRLALLRKLGHQPTWYRIPKVDAELTVALTMHVDHTDRADQTRVYATTVDAGFRNRFGYDLSAASKVTFSVVPVPPPPKAERARVMPRLYNLRIDEAEGVLRKAGIPFGFDADKPRVRDSQRVSSTNPKAGEILAEGEAVVIKLK